MSIEQLRTDPELLTYRRIEHLFDCDGDNVWYKGTVLLVMIRKMETLELCDDEIYCYPLHEIGMSMHLPALQLCRPKGWGCFLCVNVLELWREKC